MTFLYDLIRLNKSIILLINFPIYYINTINLLPHQQHFHPYSKMPRVHGQGKQKNKPFKGKSNGKKNDGKIATTKTKHISKKASISKRVKANKNELIKQKKMKKINIVQKLVKENQYLDAQTKNILANKMKSQSQIKIVLLLPCNSDADSQGLIKQIYSSIDKQSIGLKTSQNAQQMNGCRTFSAFQMFPTSNKTYLRNKIMFVSPSSSRDPNHLLDLIKCADIICPILSCKATNTKGMNLDPYIEGKAFDQTGYITLNMIRNLGVPTTVGIIQHLQLHQQKHHDKITRLFKRFLTSQLGEEQKVVTVSNPNDLNKLIRTIDSISVINQPWKNQRGYMLVQKLTKDQNTGSIVLQGFLKGNSINANQLIHITGIDDFEIESIEIHKNEGKIKNPKNAMSQQSRLIQYSTFPESLMPFASTGNNANTNAQQNELLTALEGLKFQTQNKQPQTIQKEQQNQQDYEDMEDEDLEQEQSQQIDIQQLYGDKEQERKKRIQMQMRKEDELEFQDEVEYTVDDVLREKFRNYQGLKNFKTSEWNHYENLPDQYDRIYTFKHYAKTQANSYADNISKAFAYPGFYISVSVKGLEGKVAEIQKILNKSPLIASFLLKHQRKMTMVHAKVRRNPHYPLNDTQVQSNKQYMISMGFRKVFVKPIFSRMINGTEKTKYVKKIKQDYENHYFCSFYYYNYFPPAPVSVYKVNHLNLEQIEPSPIMVGELVKCDPLHIILQRIILCGYPYKINRRRSTVRYMFFNPKDVKFFKPIQVRTKMGLRGRIQESLGTHGLMKVFFSDHIKHNDTVCMYLYSRVYPEANF